MVFFKYCLQVFCKLTPTNSQSWMLYFLLKEKSQTQISTHSEMKNDIIKNSFSSELTKQFFYI